MSCGSGRRSPPCLRSGRARYREDSPVEAQPRTRHSWQTLRAHTPPPQAAGCAARRGTGPSTARTSSRNPEASRAPWDEQAAIEVTPGGREGRSAEAQANTAECRGSRPEPTERTTAARASRANHWQEPVRGRQRPAQYEPGPVRKQPDAAERNQGQHSVGQHVQNSGQSQYIGGRAHAKATRVSRVATRDSSREATTRTAAEAGTAGTHGEANRQAKHPGWTPVMESDRSFRGRSTATIGGFKMTTGM